MPSLIGSRILRLEDEPLLRGKGRFVDDIPLPGVLHAGVAVAALQIARRRRGAPRLIGIAVLGGLVLKIVLEAPWASTLAHPRGWNIAVAPLAHAAGALSGALLHTLLHTRLKPRR